MADEAADMLYNGSITVEEFIALTKEDGGLIWPE